MISQYFIVIIATDFQRDWGVVRSVWRWHGRPCRQYKHQWQRWGRWCLWRWRLRWIWSPWWVIVEHFSSGPRLVELQTLMQWHSLVGLGKKYAICCIGLNTRIWKWGFVLVDLSWTCQLDQIEYIFILSLHTYSSLLSLWLVNLQTSVYISPARGNPGYTCSFLCQWMSPINVLFKLNVKLSVKTVFNTQLYIYTICITEHLVR